ncbi:FliM/FliN family flagellar motor C-terminal domain-containing protein [Sulfitobacter sp. PR48]|uniref:FliM/FliN family flagellar motor C-terminal domain-containing protein n=1 Tax=Sulfitobacter sp. PR48 TaxID=3028383 RepID=UPI00237BCB15|nr:FliM/FliN family flagellar motor C-terminal domain-containing protein [Sulfitobacter sp. PR48]
MGQARQNSDPGEGSVLRRKTDRGRASHQARAMTLAKSLRLGLAKVADELFDLALAALAIRVAEVSGDEVQDHFDAQHLLILLDGPDGRPAAAALDPLLVGALIQQQTMAQVLPDAGGDPRPMTDTDAAITAPFVNALISRAAALPDAPTDKRLLAGYAFGSRVDTPRLLSLALEAQAYRLITLTVDIAGGLRQGQILFCMPEPDDATAQHPTAQEGQEAASRAEQRPATLSESVLALDVALDIALARLRMPLAKLGRLQVGDLLDLNGARFDRAEVLRPGGGTLARGMLGQLDGCRALRIVPAKPAAQTPRRRASDRAELDQREPEPLPQAGMPASEPPEMQALDVSPAGADAMPDLPDLSDLPELDLSDMSDLPELDGLPGLDDLPDLDDLPELDDLPDLSERKAG